MATNKLVWVLGIGAAGYLLYEYGLSQGWWTSLTGPSVSTSVLTAAQQQAFIASATAQGLTSAQITAAFAQLTAAAAACPAGSWNPNTGSCGAAAVAATAAPATATIASNPVTVPITSPPATAAPIVNMPKPTQIYGRGEGITPAGVTAAQLIQQAGVSASTTFNADQWNYYEQRVNPGAVTSDFSSIGWSRTGTTNNPGSSQLTAAQYVALRQSAGLSGLWDPTGYAQTVPMPYALVADDSDRFDYFAEAYGVN